MRILYFGNFLVHHFYNGEGWISSLLAEMKGISNIETGMAFLGKQDNKSFGDGICFYEIGKNHNGKGIVNPLHKIQLLFGDYKVKESKKWEYYENKFRHIIEDFKPDIIQVFGSENYYGLVSGITDIPVVLHIQGLINPCKNSLLPPAVAWTNYIKWYNPYSWLIPITRNRAWNMMAYREREILKRTNHYIGRTKWDEIIVKTFNSSAHYHHGDEVLRKPFYLLEKRQIPSQPTLISIISDTSYKGLDLILKTAYVLKCYLNINFNWLVFGNLKPTFWENTVKINHTDVNVEYKGVASADTLKSNLLNSTCYIHPSYIDNSPNSICEAQITGVPVIACNVGGISSLVNHNETGFLVPTNDPYTLAYYIKKIISNNELNAKLGEKSREVALKRHDKNKIISDLLQLYSQLTNNK